MSRATGIVLLVSGALCAAACGDSGALEGVNGPCTRTSDCQSGLSCVAGQCEPPDSGIPSEGGDSSHPGSDGSSAG